jgi:peptide/nickel transport system permease protein
LRRSYQTHKEVGPLLMGVIPNTLILATTAMIFAIVIGVFLGVLSAVHQNTWIDRACRGVFDVGHISAVIFCGYYYRLDFRLCAEQIYRLNMSGSLYSYDPFKGEVITWRNLILPMVTLGLRPLAIIVQLTRSAMLDVMGQDYIRTARAKGLSERAVIYRHALKNALNPV